mmetsp:Transcript_3552/g.8272  ORF Transcript_3552/g.8272 Transcript_3552/m.8272 type:complete len:242 (+) Transcript_3552:655-1380(+)
MSPTLNRPCRASKLTSLAKPASTQKRLCSTLVTRPETLLPLRASSIGRPPACSQPSAGRAVAASSLSRSSWATCFARFRMPMSQPDALRTVDGLYVARNVFTACFCTASSSCASVRRVSRLMPSGPTGAPLSASATSGGSSTSPSRSWRTRLLSWFRSQSHCSVRLAAASGSLASSPLASVPPATRAQAVSGMARTLRPTRLQKLCLSNTSPRAWRETGCRGAVARRSTMTPRSGRKNGMM